MITETKILRHKMNHIETIKEQNFMEPNFFLQNISNKNIRMFSRLQNKN